jgi:hypothetical protein
MQLGETWSSNHSPWWILNWTYCTLEVMQPFHESQLQYYRDSGTCLYACLLVSLLLLHIKVFGLEYKRSEAIVPQYVCVWLFLYIVDRFSYFHMLHIIFKLWGCMICKWGNSTITYANIHWVPRLETCSLWICSSRNHAKKTTHWSKITLAVRPTWMKSLLGEVPLSSPPHWSTVIWANNLLLYSFL